MTNCVVGLDIATTTGWAWHRNDGMPRPFFGAMRLPGESQEVGRPADALERWLRQLYLTLRDTGPPTHYFFEAQHIAAKVNIDTVYRLIALGGVVEKFAYQTGAKVYKVHISEWRKHFIGRGSGFKRDKATKKYLPGEDPKELAIQRCGEYGWHTDVADAAEACGILDFGLSMLGEHHPRPWRDATLLRTRQR